MGNDKYVTVRVTRGNILHKCKPPQLQLLIGFLPKLLQIPLLAPFGLALQCSQSFNLAVGALPYPFIRLY
ncbi:hypothetical protein D3C80_2048750 [compost metagenome]